MENWLELSEAEYEKVWNKMCEVLNFKPSTSNFPSFEVPTPFITYDISIYFEYSNDLGAYDELEEKALLVFKENTSRDDYLYALDWQHECYWINPGLEFEKDEFDELKVPVFPNGDYYFFIHKDFGKNVTENITSGVKPSSTKPAYRSWFLLFSAKGRIS